MKNKAQVTIFIIVAIVIVVGVMIIFLIKGKTEVERPANFNPKDFVQDCVRGIVENSVQKILKNGGQRVPSQSIFYQGEELNYLCYQADYYLGCYNFHPMLESLVENEIMEDTKAGVQECFNLMKEDFENKGFEISGGATNYSIDLLPGSVEIKLSKKLSLIRDGSSQSFENFDTRVLSPIYELIRIAREVINSESQFCHFEYNGYMLLYPDYNIRRIDYRDSKIYFLIDRRTKAEFKFAVRSCAFAPGV
jgi:hypothetical protein